MIVHSNGSTFAGEAPESIDELIELLADPNYHLDPSFERYGRFFQSNGQQAAVYGHFADLSHAFRITGTTKNCSRWRARLPRTRKRLGINWRSPGTSVPMLVSSAAAPRNAARRSLPCLHPAAAPSSRRSHLGPRPRAFLA